jgi:hypothetical protein
MDNTSEALINDSKKPVMEPPPSSTYKKSKLPKSLIIIGIVVLLFPIYMVIHILPQLSGLIENLGGGPNGFLLLMSIIGIVSFFIAQIFYGITLVSAQKRQGGLSVIQKKIASGFFIFGIIVGVLSIPALIISIVSPIYAIINGIK